MALSDWLRALFTRPPGPIPTYVPDASRAYILGPAVIQPGEQVWGHDVSDFTNADYLKYAANSNAVYACAKLRASLLASLPLKFYKVKRGGGKADVTEGAVVELFQKVNPRWTLSRWIEMSEWSLCLTGQTFTFLERGASGRQPPREMWWGAPDRTKVIPHPTDYISGFIYSPMNGGTDIPYSFDQVFWMRYSNPIDEFAGLAPLAAARLAADVASAAMKTNRNLFANGINLGGVISPATGVASWSREQKKELSEMVNRDFKGVHNAGRWGLFDREIEMKQWTMTPKDAEFLGAMKWSLEDIARAFGIPQDLIGGQRTYENVAAANLAIWTDTIIPEARFFATEITEQILPMFPGEADLCEFDLSGVEALRNAERQQWTIEESMIRVGRKLINEVRADHGEKAVPWGNVWWAQTAGGGLAPVNGPHAPIAANQEIQFGGITVNEYREAKGLPPLPWGDEWWADVSKVPISGDAAQDAPGATNGENTTPPSRSTRAIAYGSPEHVAMHRRFVRRTDPWERKVADVTAALMRRQREEIVARLRDEHGAGRVWSYQASVAYADPRMASARISIGNLLDTIFALPTWVKQFRMGIRPVLAAIVEDVGQAELDDLSIGVSFDISDPNVVRFLEQRAQRFATEINATTWDQLKASLSDGLSAGEGVDDLAKRVDQVMGNRIASSAEAIARTEVTGAANGGTIESWRQSGVVDGKEWLATFDDRTRDTHAEAHGQVVGIDDDFHVGGATGPGPGLMSTADESVNCRCSLVAHLAPAPERTVTPNGHGEADLLKLAKVLGVR